MEKTDLRAQLSALRQSVDQMQALLAWLDLKAAEVANEHRPTFRMYDPTETDLQNEFSRFLASLTRIHDYPKAHPNAVSEMEQAYLIRELVKLRDQVHALDLPRRFRWL